MPALTEYNGVQILTPDPCGPGGQAINNNFKALSTAINTTDPGVDDDSTQGFSTGSRWYNSTTTEEWICEDASPGAADWVMISLLGPAGPTGPAGPAGTAWYTGTGAPTFSARSADLYLETVTGDVYLCLGGTSWTIISDLMGPAGAAGNLWYTGTGVPTRSARSGDLYLDTGSGKVYACSGGTTWTLSADLTGPAGTTGATERRRGATERDRRDGRDEGRRGGGNALVHRYQRPDSCCQRGRSVPRHGKRKCLSLLGRDDVGAVGQCHLGIAWGGDGGVGRVDRFMDAGVLGRRLHRKRRLELK